MRIGSVNGNPRSPARGRLPWVLVLGSTLLLSTLGCQSMSDGARQVGLGAQDLGRRMAAPFRRSAGQPSFGQRTPGAAGDRDPFLPPPKQPLDDDLSYQVPRRLDMVTLGKPTSLPQPSLAARRD